MFFHALRFTIALSIAAGVPFASPAQASTSASTTGILTEKHGDRLDGTVTPSTYEVVSPSGTLDLTSAPNPDWVGRTVTVTDADERRLGIQGDVKLAAAQRRTAMAPSSGARTTLVVLVALSDLSQPLTPEQARTAVFTGPTSASALFAEQSGGRSSLTGIQRGDGDVAGPLAVAAAGSGCDEDAIAEAADSAAAANGFAPASYQQIVYVLPRVPDCAWAGLGQLPGKRAWTNGYLDTSVIAHEVGHNRGNHHASSLRCTDAGGQPTALSGSCTSSEYGDPFDVMGMPARLMSSFHRAQNGDLTEDAVQRVTTSGTYSLSSANLGSGVRLLLVPRKSAGQPVSEWYALERRSPRDRFDTFAVADPVSSGVTVRLVGRLSGTEQTRLLDMLPATETLLDAPLAPGGSFSDPALAINLGVAPDGAAVEVAMPTLVDDVAPQFAGTPRVVASVGRAVVSWPQATDDEQFARYELERNGSIVGSTTALTYTDAVSGPRTVSYRVVAVDATGNRTAIGPTTATIPGATTGGAGPGSGVVAGTPRFHGPALGRIRSLGRTMRRTSRGWIVVQRFAAKNATQMTGSVDGRRVASARSGRLTVRFLFPYRATKRTVTIRASNARSQRRITSTWRM